MDEDLLGKGSEDGETKALGMGTGKCVQRPVPVWLDSVIFLNLGCASELLGEFPFKYGFARLHPSWNVLSRSSDLSVFVQLPRLSSGAHRVEKR